MTDDKLYDSLSDNLSEGGKKNRIRAMQLVAVCRYREQKEYQTHRSRLYLRESKELEQKVDAEIERVEKMMGR